MTALRQRSDRGWQWRKDGRPPDDDENAYRWDRRLGRWIAIDDDEPELDEAAFEDWEERRPERIAERNERYDDDEAEDATKKWRASRVRNFCNGALSASEASGERANVNVYVPGGLTRAPAAADLAPPVAVEPRPERPKTLRDVLDPSLTWSFHRVDYKGIIVRSNVWSGDGYLAFLLTDLEIADGLALTLAAERSAKIASVARAKEF